MALNAKELKTEIYSVTAKEDSRYSGCYLPYIKITSKNYIQTLKFKQSPNFLGFHNYDDALAFGEKEVDNMKAIGIYDDNIWQA